MQILWVWMILLLLVYTETINSKTMPTVDMYIRVMSVIFMTPIIYFGFRMLKALMLNPCMNQHGSTQMLKCGILGK